MYIYSIGKLTLKWAIFVSFLARIDLKGLNSSWPGLNKMGQLLMRVRDEYLVDRLRYWNDEDYREDWRPATTYLSQRS